MLFHSHHDGMACFLDFVILFEATQTILLVALLNEKELKIAKQLLLGVMYG